MRCDEPAPLLPEEYAAAASVWSEAFGDGVEAALSLLRDCGLGARCIALRGEGRILSLMCAFDGLSCRGRSMSYLYALCTAPEYRGRGFASRVLAASAAAAFDRGAEIAALYPADGLRTWYERSFGFRRIGGFADLPVRPKGSAAVLRRLEARELAAASPCPVSCELIRAHEIYGARCYEASFSGCTLRFLADANERGVTIKGVDITPEAASPIAVALAEEFGAEDVYIRVPNECGDLLVLAADSSRPLPEGVYFPYVLD